VQCTILASIVGALDEQRVTVATDRDLARKYALERSLRTAHRNTAVVDSHLDAVGDRDGRASYA
jgi:hypothetical protein